MSDDIDRASAQSNLYELERLAREAREQRDDWTRIAGHLGEAYQKACEERDEARRLFAEADWVIASRRDAQDWPTEWWKSWNDKRKAAIARHEARQNDEETRL